MEDAMTDRATQLINAFTQALVEFEAALEQVPSEGLDWRERGEGWSIRQIIHHVTEDCNVYTIIVERALATPGCKITFGAFPGNEAWGERLGWDTKPVEISRELMQVQRRFLAEMVAQFPDRLDNEVQYYNDVGEHLGTGNVEKMVNMLTEHMQEHTETIRRIGAEHQA
jgi:hypothetical protein